MGKKLAFKLLMSGIVSLLAGIAVFLIVQNAGYYLTARLLDDADYYEHQSITAVDTVQDFIAKNNITSENIDMLDDFSEKYTDYFYAVYEDGKLIYDSIGFFPQNLEDEGNEEYIYTLHLKDSEAEAFVVVDFETEYYNIADIVGVVMLVLVFASMFILLIKKKIKYIANLEKELRILEGGNLEYEITVKGKDELGELAKSVDDMRRSILQRENEDRQVVKANKDMITALSHDIRTPLTSLLGYIELMNNKKYKNEEQLEHFITMSREKTLRIKEMTDSLFSYSLESVVKKPRRYEVINAYEFVQQVVCDNIIELENIGFTVNYDNKVFSGNIKINPENVVRIFENIVSNLKKYADFSEPIVINSEAKDDIVSVICKNKISDKKPETVSTGIGIKSCISIAENNNASFESYEKDGWFYSIVKFKLFND